MNRVESGVEGGSEIEDQGYDLTVKVLYLLGFLPALHPNPTPEDYSRLLSPRLARLLARSRLLRRSLRLFQLFVPWNLMVYTGYHMIIVHPVDIYLSWDNKLDVIEGVFAILAFIVIFFTLVAAMYHKNRLGFVVRLFQSFYIRCSSETGEVKRTTVQARKLVNNLQRASNFISLVLLVVSILGAVLYFQPNRKFVVSGWYPYDKYASPAYEITLYVWAIQLVFTLFVANTFICSGVTSYIQIVVYFEILAKKLENIKDISLEGIRERRKATKALAINYYRRSVNNLLMPRVAGGPSDRVRERGGVVWERRPQRGVVCETHPQRGVVFEARPQRGVVCETHPQRGVVFEARPLRGVVCEPRPQRGVTENQKGGDEYRTRPGEVPTVEKTGMDANQKIFHRRRRDKSTEIRITKNELEKEMRKNLAECVKFHRKILRSTVELGLAWELHYSTIYISDILIFSVMTIMLSSVDYLSFREWLGIFVSIQINGLYLLENYFADKITTKAAAVGEAIYSCDWLEASPTFKRSMLIIMSRANLPLLLKPTGLHAHSLKNFAEVSNTAYKMLATTRTMVAK